jgi:hypothetical protein
VALVRLYSNLPGGAAKFLRARCAASTPRPSEGPKRPRPHQRRLSPAEVLGLIAACGQGESIKHLAQRGESLSWFLSMWQEFSLGFKYVAYLTQYLALLWLKPELR